MNDNPNPLLVRRAEGEAGPKLATLQKLLHMANPTEDHSGLLLRNGHYDLPYGGYVKLIDHMGQDEAIIAAARMSTDGAFRGWGPFACSRCDSSGRVPYVIGIGDDKAKCPMCHGKGSVPGDEKLLTYLWENGHTSPFEMCELVFEIEAPIFVARQVFRHRTFSYNEFSQRYSEVGGKDDKPELSEEYAWSPPVGGWRVDAKVAKARNKQGSTESTEVFDEQEAAAFCAANEADLETVYKTAWLAYRRMLERGTSKEQARTVLPLGTFTRWRQKGNLRNWLAYLRQRLHPHAQLETRQVAAVQALFIVGLFQRTWALFERELPEPQEG